MEVSLPALEIFNVLQPPNLLLDDEWNVVRLLSEEREFGEELLLVACHRRDNRFGNGHWWYRREPKQPLIDVLGDRGDAVEVIRAAREFWRDRRQPQHLAIKPAQR